MKVAIPLPQNSLIRAPLPGTDRGVPCDMGDGQPFVTMRESQLSRRAGMHEDENEIAAWVEYRLEGKLVHRSVHVHLKKAGVAGESTAAALG